MIWNNFQINRNISKLVVLNSKLVGTLSKFIWNSFQIHILEVFQSIWMKFQIDWNTSKMLGTISKSSGILLKYLE